MNILVCGARGFVGSAVCASLQMAGHDVIAGVRQAPGAASLTQSQRSVDFVNWLRPDDWGDALDHVDAVVNAVGVLRGTCRAPIHHIHTLAPIALYEACAQRGIRRVVHVSALGIEHSRTAYAQTKREAEEALFHLNDADQLDAVVVRPSIIFGRGGQSSALFMRLAGLSVQVLPAEARDTRVQPVSVQDLAEAIAGLLMSESLHAVHRGVMDVCGPQPLTLADFINLLRVQLGRQQARQYFLPSVLGRWSAVLADLMPVTPWGKQALELLSRDNTGDPAAMVRILGHALTSPAELVERTWKQEG